MINLFGVKISGVRFFCGIKVSDKFEPTTYTKPGLPFTSTRYPTNSKVAAFCAAMWTTLVVHIFAIRNQSKVGDTVIVSDAVNMVDQFGRPDAVRPKPCELMCEKSSSSNADLDITLGVFSSGDTTSWCTVAWPSTPSKMAGIWVVVQQTLDFCKIKIVHAVAPVCNGLKSDGSVLTHRAVAPL